MFIGFTGTRLGMTKEQTNSVCHLLKELKATALLHGDCVGADEGAHVLAQGLGLKICIHPPRDEKLRAHCHGANWVGRPTEYHSRNRSIVRECEALIAAPATMAVEQGGTWSTIKMARQIGKAFFIVCPDGSVYREGWLSVEGAPK